MTAKLREHYFLSNHVKDDCQRLRDTIAEMQELEARRLSGPKKERAELMAQLKKLRRFGES